MKTADKEKLWDAYRQKKTQEIREQLIIEYAQLVKLVAGRLSMYLGHNVEYDDLVSYGIFGLIDAIDKFDLEKNVKFETYASLRIRGAILDQIRKMDWIPRSVRQRQRKIDEAMKQIEMRTGKTASDEELAKQLGLTDEELCSWQTQLKVTNVVSLNEFEETGPEPMIDSAHPVRFSQPEEVVEEEELKEKLAESLELLTEKERRVIELYYYEDMTLKEISKILEVSESRISQLHTKASRTGSGLPRQFPAAPAGSAACPGYPASAAPGWGPSPPAVRPAARRCAAEAPPWSPSALRGPGPRRAPSDISPGRPPPPAAGSPPWADS